MKVFAISDLHLDSTGEKPMSVFGGAWENYEERLFESINEEVSEDDIILIPGDHSWALRLDDAMEDLKTINDFPGTKYLSKGNHDYWWGTLSKLNALGFDKINFVQTNGFVHNGVGICGTRGWTPKDSEGFSEKDLKVFNRELTRLEIALDTLKGQSLNKKIVMLHYPPFDFSEGKPNEFAEIMEREGVDICVYGHLHAEGHQFAREGLINGVEYFLVSCDFIEMKPKLIYENKY